MRRGCRRVLNFSVQRDGIQYQTSKSLRNTISLVYSIRLACYHARCLIGGHYEHSLESGRGFISIDVG